MQPPDRVHKKGGVLLAKIGAKGINGRVLRGGQKEGVDMNRLPAEKPGKLTYLSNAGKMFRLFGYPRVSLDELIRMQAEWIKNGGPSLGKPTHFEVTNGKY